MIDAMVAFVFRTNGWPKHLTGAAESGNLTVNRTTIR